MATPRPECSGATRDDLARFARLELSGERKEVVGPVVDRVYGLVDRLDAVDLGDVSPATAFDARWE